MTVIFFCASLEPGKDGVGDYTRSLASELMCQGHTTLALAFYDQHIQEVWEGEQLNNQSHLRVLRLPVALSNNLRVDYAKKWINKISPDLISLQFVPYGFNKKGLPFLLANQLKRISFGFQWHIMFHELWIGNREQDSVKDKFVGYLQRYIIRRLVRKLSPITINTNIDFYKKLLAKHDIHADVWPVYSNLNANLNFELNPKIFASDNEHTAIVVLFGAIHPVNRFTENICILKSELEDLNKKLTLIHVGKFSAATALLKDIQTSLGCECFCLGEQSDSFINALLKRATIGLSTYNYDFVGKSGSIAAMLSNGLPVVLLRSSDMYSYTCSQVRYINDIDSLSEFIALKNTFLTSAYTSQLTVENFQKMLVASQ